MRYTIRYIDSFGATYLDGVRSLDRENVLARVRHARLAINRGGYVTGAIPGYGVAVDVRMVEVAE